MERLEARIGPRGFCVDSVGFRFLYFGGEGVLVAPTPCSVEDWIEHQSRAAERPAAVAVTIEDVVAARRAHQAEVVAAGARVGLRLNF
jgi:hypothetical protein